MALSLENLDSITREYMHSELESDISNGTVYFSPRLIESGHSQYVVALRKAIIDFDDPWLAEQIRLGSILKDREQRRTRNGTTMAKVPATAPDTLAEGEFNRYYIRGLCLRAIADGIPELEIYRAKEVAIPRSDSQLLIGSKESVDILLRNARVMPGSEDALGLPHGPNSGLSVRLP